MTISATPRSHMLAFLGGFLVLLANNTSAGPLSESKLAELKTAWQQQITQATQALDADAENLDALSRRGDAYFFSGEFPKALADYEQMVKLNPGLANSHWRRGIAYFYAEDFPHAAAQFEAYHSYDDIDRENGIWRYLSLAKAKGLPAARKTLLKYRKTDREPFPAVYQLFEGKLTPKEILTQIEQAEISKTEREKRLFYAHLYIGLNHVVLGQDQPALNHLQKSVDNSWPETAGYGPHWMWHVGRLQADLLEKKKLAPKLEKTN